MSTIHFKQTTTATPEQFIAGLTDFGPGRSQLFGNSTDEYLKVHEKGTNSADVTEGSGGIWERLRYDWSDPNPSFLRLLTRTFGEVTQATPIPSCDNPTELLTSTW